MTAEADKAYLTTDDPGFENAQDICEEIDAGIDHSKCETVIELDREKAIKEAISEAGPDDVVLLCGKGLTPSRRSAG